MPPIILIRHCAAAGQHPDAPLTPAGRQQAQLLKDFLAHHPINLVATGEYRRARETAQPLAHALGLTPRVDPRLNERILSPQPIPNWREILRDSFADPNLRAPGGESAQQVLTRAWAALNQLAADHQNTPAVVTHGNLISIVLNFINPTFGYQGWANLSNPDVYLLDGLPNAEPRYQRIWK